VLSLEKLYGGARSSVCALVVDGDSEVKRGSATLDGRAVAKLRGVIRQLAESEFIRNEQKFRRLDAGIFEMKLHNPPVRLFCFEYGSLWVCTHVASKPGKRHLQDHVARVKALRERVLMEGMS
jgi:hypothetical protein